MSVLTATSEDPRGSLWISFAAASMLVVAAVVAAWVWVKNSADVVLVPAWQTQVTVTLPEEQAPSGARFLLEQADLAFAAGRVVSPRYDNALHFYRAVLVENPADPDAQDGLVRIGNWLQVEIQRAVSADDWGRAGELAGELAALDGVEGDAEALVRRVQVINDLLAAGRQQLTADRLSLAAGEEALRAFGRVIQLDPGNGEAADGLRLVAVDLLLQAQGAIMAGDHELAERYIAMARRADPAAEGLERLAESASSWRRLNAARQVDDLLVQAGAALADDRLAPPAEQSAWALFTTVLEREAGHPEALRGLQDVRARLVQRGWDALAAGDMRAAGLALQQARASGASEGLGALEQELAFRERVVAARAGRFDRVLAVSDLVSTRRVAADYPRSAQQRGQEGWVTLEFTVTETGAVADVEVTDSSAEVFDEAAIAALSEWSFEPHRERGQALPVRAAVRFTFQL